jgi:anti-sigma regulatory factor (Ser/Thr protein kinase)
VSTTVRILVEDSSKTSEARRTAREMALQMGMDGTGAERVAIVVTEACTNLMKHAVHGQLLLQSIVEGDHPVPLLELLVMDQGPGMSNLAQCLQDGYSTNPGLGQGLGAIQRMSKHSDIYTIPARGTAILARWWASSNGLKQHSLSRLGSVNVPKPGEEVCGDAWGSAQHGQEQIILLADGLGHGMEARLASLAAVRQLHEAAELPPKALLTRVHQALRSTRGAAVAIAHIDGTRGKLSFAGVGNISGRIYAGSTAQQHLVSMNGTAGHQCERMQEFSYPWPADGLLILHSDGLSSNTGLDTYPDLVSHDPALIAGVLYRDFFRGRDDATVVVAKAA